MTREQKFYLRLGIFVGYLAGAIQVGSFWWLG